MLALLYTFTVHVVYPKLWSLYEVIYGSMLLYLIWCILAV